QGRCHNDFRDQGRTSGRWLRGCRRVVRRAAGPALPTRRAKPRRVTEQGGRDLKRTLEFGFSFFGGAALLAAGSLGLWSSKPRLLFIARGQASAPITSGVARCPLGEQKAKGTMA